MSSVTHGPMATGAPLVPAAWIAAQNTLLEMIVRGQPLREVLAAACAAFESLASPASPSVAIRLAADPGPSPVPPAASAWSLPIAASGGDLLGTLELRFDPPRGPSVPEQQLAMQWARTAALAIERHAADAALRDSAAMNQFLARLAADTQPLTEPEAVMAVSARLLAEYLGVDRCAYATVEDERVFVITGDYPRGAGVRSIVGRWEVAAFGAACVADMAAGRPYVVADAENDARIGPAEREAYRATQIRAVVCVPLHKDGRFTAAMAVHQATPRRFTPAEAAVVAVVVARCWEALERIRVVNMQRAADQQLAVNRGRLDYAVRLSGVGFWYCVLPFGELHWDERVKEHFFLPPDARVTIEEFYARIHPDDREPTRRAIEQSLRDGSSYDSVYRTVNPQNGEVRWIRALGGPAMGPDGRPTHFDGVTVDVTRPRLVQEQLAEALQHLREQDRRKDEFLATLAHELRNPLAPIRTGLQILRSGASDEQKARTRDMMERQLRHLVRLVDDLLDISRITLGKVELQRERIDFRAVLDSALETTRPLFESSGHELVTRLPQLPMPVDVDATRMTQVLANLLNNAVKFTPAGGRIEIEAQRQGGELVVRIRDNGIGIPGEMLGKVFDMFMQVGRSTERRQGGLGIGLTLVRSLVGLHGGSVVAESAGPGQGTQFTLRLPLATAAVRPAASVTA